MKVLVFGGAFDPPHIGHLIVADWIREEMNIERVLFIPYFRNKDKIPVASPKDRLTMISLAIEGWDGFVLDDVEIRRGGISYTIDTVEELLTRGIGEIYWIIGEDSVDSLTSWKEWEKLIKLVKFVVAPRWGEKGSKKDYLIYSNAPRIEISSSLIRERIKAGKSVRFLLPEQVWAYIEEKRLYR